MLVNTAQKDQNNKRSQVIRLSNLVLDNLVKTSELEGGSLTDRNFKMGISRLLKEGSTGKSAKANYSLQQVISQNEDELLDLDVLWGYESESTYKISRRGILQPIIVERIVRPHNFGVNKTIFMDTNDLKLLTNTAKIGVTRLSGLEKLIIDNQHYINAITTSNSINILNNNDLNVFKNLVTLLKKYNVKYHMDLTKCIVPNPNNLLDILRLYGSCDDLGIEKLYINETTLFTALQSYTNLDWLTVNRLYLKIGNNIRLLPNTGIPVKKNLNEMVFDIDFEFNETYFRKAVSLLSTLVANKLTLILHTTQNMLMTTACAKINSLYSKFNIQTYVDVNLEAMNRTVTTMFEDYILDIPQRYGTNVNGLIFRNGRVTSLESNKKTGLHTIVFQFNSGNEVIFKIRSQGRLLILNVCSVFNNLSYLITKATPTANVIYIDENDIINFDYFGK